MMDEDFIIKDIRKNSIEMLRVSLNSFKGSKFLSLRYFYDSSGKGIRWLAGKKGTTISLEMLPELKEAIEKAIEAVEAWSKEVDDE